MTSQSDDATTFPFYIAENGHKFVPGETFPDMDDNIIDGMTSYDESHWVALKPDGSREVVDSTPLIFGSNAHLNAQDLLDDNPGSDVHYIRHPSTHFRWPTTWMNYNWDIVTDVVNQVPFLNKWKYFVARSAHEFDWTMNAHSLEGLSENERWTVHHQMYGLIAAPWILMLLLESTDATEEIAGNLLWKTYQTSVEEVLVGLCHECEDTATFARLYAHNANLELHRGALVSGKVHETDRTVTPWGLGDVITEVVAPLGETATAEKIAQFHRQNRAEFLRALNFYATDVGLAERPHSHEA